MNLFCFPYAGGSSAIYATWKKLMAPGIQLHTPELAGRGRRLMDDKYPNAAAAVDDMLSMIRSEINSGPYAIFGHSMGAMLSLRLLQRLQKEGLPMPVHAFFSGRKAIQVQRDKRMLADLPAEEFKKEVLELGGTPKEFFEEPELMELFLPTLRSDFKLAEDNRFDPVVTPFDLPISVLVGMTEDLLPEEVTGWKEWTTETCQITYFKGGHFFINDNREGIIRLINQTLTKQEQHLPL